MALATVGRPPLVLVGAFAVILTTAYARAHDDRNHGLAGIRRPRATPRAGGGMDRNAAEQPEWWLCMQRDDVIWRP